METHQTADATVPRGIDRKAPVIARHDRIIAAPIELLWALHTDVPRWWQKDIATAMINDPLAPGTSFVWTTPGLDMPITSTIYAIEPLASILWGGPSGGIVGIHSWVFETVPSGTRIATEESWAGPSVAAKPAEAEAMLAASLVRWLDYIALAVA